MPAMAEGLGHREVKHMTALSLEIALARLEKLNYPAIIDCGMLIWVEKAGRDAEGVIDDIVDYQTPCSEEFVVGVPIIHGTVDFGSDEVTELTACTEELSNSLVKISALLIRQNCGR